jgi:hypothetical protein
MIGPVSRFVLSRSSRWLVLSCELPATCFRRSFVFLLILYPEDGSVCVPRKRRTVAELQVVKAHRTILLKMVDFK